MIQHSVETVHGGGRGRRGATYNTMAGRAIALLSVFISEVCVAGGVSLLSRDDAVLVVGSVPPLPLSLGAGHGVVRHVGDPHSAVRPPRRQRVRLRRRRGRRAGAAVAARVLVSDPVFPHGLIRLERFVIVSAESNRPTSSRLSRGFLTVY